MKPKLLFSIIFLPVAAGVQLSLLANDARTLAACSVVATGPHERVWQSLTVDEQGVTNVSSYTELATGLNFWNEASQKWEETKEAFFLTSDGYAVATNGPHKVILAPDIVSSGSVDFLTEDGVRLLSNPMGLSFTDASGKSVMIAEVTNSIGELATGNSIVYPNAFDSVRAALTYTYTRSGFEQDVILYQKLPSPTEWGLDPETTKLQIWTEILSPVRPQIGKSDSTDDQELDFGQTRLRHGVAYLLGTIAVAVGVFQIIWNTIAIRINRIAIPVHGNIVVTQYRQCCLSH